MFSSQNTAEQFLQVSDADFFTAAFSACTTAGLYLSAAVRSQITDLRVDHGTYKFSHTQKKEKILLHSSEVGNTGAKAPTYLPNCFAVLEPEEKILHQAISE